MKNEDRTILLVILLIALLSVLSGCSEKNPVESPTTLIQTEMTTAATPTPSPTPTPTPTLTPEQQEEKDLQEKLALAPIIEGTEKVIKEINGLKRVTYEKDGVYIGEFKKEVTQTDENGEAIEVGGVALIGSEAETILSEQLETLPEGDKWLMALPVDISDLTALNNVNLDLSADPFFSEPYCIRISFNKILASDEGTNISEETLSISNVMPGETTFRQAIYPTRYDYYSSVSAINGDSKEIVSGEEIQFITVFAQFCDDTWIADGKDLAMGDCLGHTYKPVLVCMNPLVGKLNEQSFDKLLKIEGVPVFVISEQSEPS